MELWVENIKTIFLCRKYFSWDIVTYLLFLIKGFLNYGPHTSLWILWFSSSLWWQTTVSPYNPFPDSPYINRPQEHGTGLSGCANQICPHVLLSGPSNRCDCGASSLLWPPLSQIRKLQTQDWPCRPPTAGRGMVTPAGSTVELHPMGWVINVKKTQGWNWEIISFPVFPQEVLKMSY